MEIIWHGYSCFTLKSKNGTVVINPYQPEIGLKLPNLKAEAVVVSNETPDYNNTAAVAGSPKILTWPGEYEVSGVAITSEELRNAEQKTSTMLFTFDTDGFKVCYLTDLNTPFTDEMVESIGQVDVLILPANGQKGYKEAHQIVEEIEPRIVIPMHYKTPGLKVEIATLDDFAKHAGITNVEPKDKLVISNKNDLPQDKTEFVILKPQTA